jgi:integrase
MFKKAVQWRVIEASPAVALDKPSEPKHKTRYLAVEEWNRVKAQSPPWLRPILELAVSTGMRLKELVALRWDDVDQSAGFLYVASDTKTGSRPVPLTEAARSVLRSRVRHLRSPYVFVDSSGQPYTSEKARARISKRTRGVMKAAKVEGASFHTLRHTAGSWMVQHGTPLYEVQLILGHSTPAMTQRYAHLQPDHLKGAARALDAALEAVTSP